VRFSHHQDAEADKDSKQIGVHITGVGKCTGLGDFEHHFQVFVGDEIYPIVG
jgi:hypothetical protein